MDLEQRSRHDYAQDEEAKSDDERILGSRPYRSHKIGHLGSHCPRARLMGFAAFSLWGFRPAPQHRRGRADQGSRREAAQWRLWRRPRPARGLWAFRPGYRGVLPGLYAAFRHRAGGRGPGEAATLGPSGPGPRLGCRPGGPAAIFLLASALGDRICHKIRTGPPAQARRPRGKCMDAAAIKWADRLARSWRGEEPGEIRIK